MSRKLPIHRDAIFQLDKLRNSLKAPAVHFFSLVDCIATSALHCIYSGSFPLRRPKQIDQTYRRTLFTEPRHPSHQASRGTPARANWTRLCPLISIVRLSRTLTAGRSAPSHAADSAAAAVSDRRCSTTRSRVHSHPFCRCFPCPVMLSGLV